MVNLTMREEITILTLFFTFCLLTIPIIILSSGDYLKPNYQIKVDQNYRRMNYREKAIVESVIIIENHNRNHFNTENISMSIFMNVDEEEFADKFYKILPRLRDRQAASNDEIKRVWKLFTFENQSVLTTTNNLSIPLKVDWRERNVVSPIKSLNACSACWAISVIGVIESMTAIKTGVLSKLSISQMVECNDVEMNCLGGDTFGLLKWLYNNKINIQTEEEFTKSDDENKCTTDKLGIRVKDFSLNNFTDNEHLMLLHLAHRGPLIASVNSANWLFYANDIIQTNCDHKQNTFNHAVEIIGYDMTANIPYYIVKNSWGPNYGIDGYVKIAIGSNLCGIAERVSSVIIE